MARLAFLIIGFLLFAAPVHAQTSYVDFLNDLAAEAVGKGINQATVQSALSYAFYDPRVIQYDQRQPEGTLSFTAYSKNILNVDRVKKGASYLKSYSGVLHDIGQKYDVAPEVILALWGIESGFGRNTGDFELVSSLATLAYEGRRAAFFRGELMFVFQILDRLGLPSSHLRGSWAGAMGQCQFMPSTYIKYAVDFDQDGRADIWTSHLDVWASIANYLAAEGWKSNLTWGREVRLTKPLSTSIIGLNTTMPLSEWSRWGVRPLGKGRLSQKNLSASLLQPDGPHGRSFLVYDNFRALMRWNRSTNFALTVGLLSDQIKVAPQKTRDMQLKKAKPTKRKKR